MVNRPESRTGFRGLQLAETQLQAKSFECSGCANRCEVVEIMQEGISLARWETDVESGLLQSVPASISV
ncbi:hypothetical protein [Desulfosporosinus burensis]